MLTYVPEEKKITGRGSATSHIPKQGTLYRSNAMSERDSICASSEKLEVEYRAIGEFPGYLAGSDGSVWSTFRRRHRVAERHTDYTRVTLSRSNKSMAKLVHRLVAIAFLGPVPDGLEVNHKDGNRTNNMVSNLEYVTRSENIRHAQNVLGSYRGVKHPLSKLSEDDVREIRRLYPQLPMAGKRRAKFSVLALAKQFGIERRTLEEIAKGNRWRHVT